MVNSLAQRGCGPVVLVHTQDLRFFFKRKSPLGRFGECPMLMEERTLRIRGLGSALDPERTSATEFFRRPQAHPAKIASTWRVVMITKRFKAFDDEEAQPKSTRRASVSSLV
jgi:hypothetical protein